jgi:hypothetical protein
VQVCGDKDEEGTLLVWSIEVGVESPTAESDTLNEAGVKSIMEGDVEVVDEVVVNGVEVQVAIINEERFPEYNCDNVFPMLIES